MAMEEQLQLNISEEPVKADFDSDSIVRLQNSLLNGQYKFNVHQWRLFLGFLACLYENEFDLRYYNLSVIDLYNLAKKDHKDALKLLRKDAKGLMKHVVEIKEKKQIEQDEISFVNLFYKAKYLPKQGILQLAPHPELLGFYKELQKNFTDAYLEEVLKLSTSNTIKIYLILKQYEDTGWVKKSFDDLKRQLGLSPTQYKRPIDLERRFIKKAQEELKDTDMAFEYSKYGTPAKGFHFRLKFVKEPKAFIPQTPEEKRAYQNLEDAGLTNEQINEIMSSVSAKEIFKVYYQMEIARSNHQIKSNEAAWLVNQFKKEYNVYSRGYKKPENKRIPSLEKH